MSRTEKASVLRAITAYIGKLWLPSLAGDQEKVLTVDSRGGVSSIDKSEVGGGYNPPIPQTDVQNLTSDLLKSQGVISVTASGSVTAGSLGRLINDGGVLKAKQVSKTLLRNVIGVAASTTNAFSEVSACSINGILVLFYRGTSAYPTVLAINPLTGAKGTPVTLVSTAATALGISTNGVNCLCTYTKSSVGQAVAITVNTGTLAITAGAETALTCLLYTSPSPRDS